MKSTLDYRDGHLCILNESEIRGDGSGALEGMREWYVVREAAQAEVATLIGRPVRHVDPDEGLYVDEDGTSYQLADMGETKPIAVEHLPNAEKAELEVLLEASLKGSKENGNGRPKRLLKKNRNGDRKQQKLQIVAAKEKGPLPLESTAPSVNAPALEDPARLNLRQKLAEVRRRIGYIQKRGHNERANYSYATAADIAGSIGDILSELGVVVIPRLENITYESSPGRGETARMAQVVMAYTFSDVDSGEEIVAKVAGQGLDSGDKAPYKAMTGALKYVLLQSFLLATGDDPENDRVDAPFNASGSDRPINSDEIQALEKLIEETGTELERVLAYYKVASLGEMTETAYQRALEILNRKLANRRPQETVHAQD